MSFHRNLHLRRRAHLCLELHLRRFKGIVWREVDVDKEHAASIRAVARAHNGRLCEVAPLGLISVAQEHMRSIIIHRWCQSDTDSQSRCRELTPPIKQGLTHRPPQGVEANLPVEQVVPSRSGTAGGRRVLLQVLHTEQAVELTSSFVRLGVKENSNPAPRFACPSSALRVCSLLK